MIKPTRDGPAYPPVPNKPTSGGPSAGPKDEVRSLGYDLLLGVSTKSFYLSSLPVHRFLSLVHLHPCERKPRWIRSSARNRDVNRHHTHTHISIAREFPAFLRLSSISGSSVSFLISFSLSLFNDPIRRVSCTLCPFFLLVCICFFNPWLVTKSSQLHLPRRRRGWKSCTMHTPATSENIGHNGPLVLCPVENRPTV